MRQFITILSVLLITNVSGYGQSIEEGEINGAEFQIVVPEEWNGGLVMYAHGYEETEEFWGDLEEDEEHDDEEVDEEEEEDEFYTIFTKRGFAFAASAYRRKGIVVKEGIEDNEALRDYFVQKYGQPDLTVITGHSMGGVITLATIEKYPTEYDAALPLCGWLGPVQTLFKNGLDMLVTFDYLFGENGGELVAGDMVSISTIETYFNNKKKKFGTYFGQRFRLKEEHIPMVIDFMQRTLKETTWLRGGLPVGNDLTIYDGFGFTDNELNHNIKRYKANPKAAEHMINYYTPKGIISDPVFALHTTYDELLPATSYEYYVAAVKEMGNEDLYHQEYVVRDGHCFFTLEEVGDAFDKLIKWTRNGTKPEITYR